MLSFFPQSQSFLYFVLYIFSPHYFSCFVSILFTYYPTYFSIFALFLVLQYNILYAHHQSFAEIFLVLPWLNEAYAEVSPEAFMCT